MFAFVILAAATAATPTSPNPLSTPVLGRTCDSGIRRVDRREMGRIWKLTEVPPAQQILTVYREENRCPKPVVVRRDIGNK